MILANDLITFFISGSLVFSNGPKSLPRNPPDCIILDNWVFDSLLLVVELYEKALQRFSTCLLVNNNSCGKLILSSESPIIYYAVSLIALCLNYCIVSIYINKN